ncbi:hypothetical protein DIPPA_23394 [Diplonema papillatum]|nr:hypothetical protein DIPPA_23394 [Diplonema papillatum]
MNGAWFTFAKKSRCSFATAAIAATLTDMFWLPYSVACAAAANDNASGPPTFSSLTMSYIRNCVLSTSKLCVNSPSSRTDFPGTVKSSSRRKTSMLRSIAYANPYPGSRLRSIGASRLLSSSTRYNSSPCGSRLTFNARRCSPRSPLDSGIPNDDTSAPALAIDSRAYSRRIASYKNRGRSPFAVWMDHRGKCGTNRVCSMTRRPSDFSVSQYWCFLTSSSSLRVKGLAIGPGNVVIGTSGASSRAPAATVWWTAAAKRGAWLTVCSGFWISLVSRPHRPLAGRGGVPCTASTHVSSTLRKRPLFAAYSRKLANSRGCCRPPFSTNSFADAGMSACRSEGAAAAAASDGFCPCCRCRCGCSPSAVFCTFIAGGSAAPGPPFARLRVGRLRSAIGLPLDPLPAACPEYWPAFVLDV